MSRNIQISPLHSQQYSLPQSARQLPQLRFIRKDLLFGLMLGFFLGFLALGITGCSASANSSSINSSSVNQRASLKSTGRYNDSNTGGSNRADGGGLLRKADGSSIPPLTKPMTPAQRDAVMNEVGKNFVYSNALGNTALNVGLAVLFPPYIVALLGNGALELAGYEPLSVSQVMPEPVKDYYVGTRDGITSAPGQAVAWVNGEEFRTESMAKKAISSAMMTRDEQVRK